MIVYLNGKFVAEEKAAVSIFDRGFLYGDGLFESIRYYGGAPFLWEKHMERFAAGADWFGITPPLTSGEMAMVVRHLMNRNNHKDAIARIVLSRGTGPRGYSPRHADHPTLAISVHPVDPANPPPRSGKVVTASLRLLARDPVSQFKSSNKLRQVLARAEADEAGAQEAILLNENGHVTEGTTTNIFWWKGSTLHTPPLSAGALEGATRAYVLTLAAALKIRAKERTATLPEVLRADGIFVTSTGIEIMEVTHWDGARVAKSPLTRKLRQAWRKQLPS